MKVIIALLLMLVVLYFAGVFAGWVVGLVVATNLWLGGLMMWTAFTALGGLAILAGKVLDEIGYW